MRELTAFEMNLSNQISNLLNNNLICNLLICSVDVNFDTIYTVR